MSSEKYNGFTNRATWAVSLWAHNDENFSYLSALNNKELIIDNLKEFFLLENYVNHAAILDIYDISSTINWEEIADHILE